MGLHTITLEDIWIDSTLGKEPDTIKLPGLFLEHPDELCSDYLPLLLRLCNACKLIEKAVHSIDVDEICIHLMPEYLDNLLWLTFPEKTMIDMNAYKILSDSLYQKSCDYG